MQFKVGGLLSLNIASIFMDDVLAQSWTQILTFQPSDKGQ